MDSLNFSINLFECPIRWPEYFSATQNGFLMGGGGHTGRITGANKTAPIWGVFRGMISKELLMEVAVGSIVSAEPELITFP